MKTADVVKVAEWLRPIANRLGELNPRGVADQLIGEYQSELYKAMANTKDPGQTVANLANQTFHSHLSEDLRGKLQDINRAVMMAEGMMNYRLEEAGGPLKRPSDDLDDEDIPLLDMARMVITELVTSCYLVRDVVFRVEKSSVFGRVGPDIARLVQGLTTLSAFLEHTKFLQRMLGALQPDVEAYRDQGLDYRTIVIPGEDQDTVESVEETLSYFNLLYKVACDYARVPPSESPLRVARMESGSIELILVGAAIVMGAVSGISHFIRDRRIDDAAQADAELKVFLGVAQAHRDGLIDDHERLVWLKRILKNHLSSAALTESGKTFNIRWPVVRGVLESGFKGVPRALPSGNQEETADG